MQALVLAWKVAQDQTCENCGGDLTETTNPANEFIYDASAWICFGCQAIKRRADVFYETRPKSTDPRWVLSKIE